MRLRHLAPAALLFLAACSNYEFSVNDNVVYTPPPLFSDYSIPDPALSKCVKNQVLESSIKRAEQLKKLFCPGGGIQSMEGIQVFTSVTLIGVSDNKIDDINALAELTKLNQINLAGNNLNDVSVLGKIETLSYINLKGNDSLNCASLSSLNSAVHVEKPEHCH